MNPPFLLPIASRKWIGCKIVANLQHPTQHNGNFVSLFVAQGWPLRSIGHQNIPEYNMDPPFAGLLHQANGSRARLLPTYSTQPNTMVIYDGYLTSSSSLSVPYLGSKPLWIRIQIFLMPSFHKIFPHLTWCPWPKGYFESIFHNWRDHWQKLVVSI